MQWQFRIIRALYIICLKLWIVRPLCFFEYNVLYYEKENELHYLLHSIIKGRINHSLGIKDAKTELSAPFLFLASR